MFQELKSLLVKRPLAICKVAGRAATVVLALIGKFACLKQLKIVCVEFARQVLDGMLGVVKVTAARLSLRTESCAPTS
jgi:hypothetical protein